MTAFGWDALLERQDDYIGGDVLIEIGGSIYRGPLKALVEQPATDIAPRQISIEMRWVAEQINGVWHTQALGSIPIPCHQATPTLETDKRVVLTKDGSTITLFLAADGNHPDPSLVNGLPLP